MLIRFSVGNYRSFNEIQSFSMVAGKQTLFPEHLRNIDGHRILKSSFLFGANASGKSNFIHAIDCMCRLVRSGEATSSEIQDIYFRINNENKSKPGVFQVEFIADSHIYSYGFSINYQKRVFEAEWLYEIKASTEECIFERGLHTAHVRSDLQFHQNKEDGKRYDVYSEDINNRQLFLSEVAEKNIPKDSLFQHFKRVYRWFSNIVVIYPQSHAIINNFFFPNENNNNFLRKMLCDFDTGIEDLSSQEKSLEETLSFLPPPVQQKFKNQLDQDADVKRSLLSGNDVMVDAGQKHFTLSLHNGEIQAKEIMMDHGNEEDLFDLDDESDGTKRLFDLIPAYELLKQGKVVFIDEIDRSFHSKLTQEYIRRYFEVTSGINSQLICTTHDLDLLSLKLLRKDEIWFVERGYDHSSRMYSLNEFKTRYDKNIANDYLLGRYGAIPCFSESNDEEE